jgi:peptidoglycan/LPS O-acetylase OafA/YrhL
MSHDQNHTPHSPTWLDSWHVSPSLNKDYDVIDGLRGIAILMVVACHILYHDPAGGTLERLIGGTIWAGAYGVTVFFALSGFLISLPFWKRKSQGNPRLTPPGYARRRFWKIYPPLAISLLLLAPGYFIRYGDSTYFSIALEWLAGLPLITSVDGKFNPVMWSLIIEVHFYATLPLLFLLTRKLSYGQTLKLIFVTLLVVPVLFRWWYASHGMAATLHPMIQTRFPSSLDSFAFGVLIGGLETIRSIRREWVRLADLGLLLLVLGLFLSSLFTYFGLEQSAAREEGLGLMIRIAAGLMILYIADTSFSRTRLFSSTWLRWVGVISYEWYLFHQPVFQWTRRAFGGASGGSVVNYMLIVGISAGVSLSLAALTYRYFSLPILRWGRNRAKAAAVSR